MLRHNLPGLSSFSVIRGVFGVEGPFAFFLLPGANWAFLFVPVFTRTWSPA